MTNLTRNGLSTKCGRLPERSAEGAQNLLVRFKADLLRRRWVVSRIGSLKLGARTMLGRAKDGVRGISRRSLEDLLSAHEHAQHVNIDQWQFAVELSELRSAGLSRTEIRRLIHEGLVEHAFETTDAKDGDREFRPPGSTRFTDASCFVLTDAGVEFAISLGSRSTEPLRPQWNLQDRELTFDGELVKRYRVPAQNQEAILTAFEEEAWTRCIDDPLPPIPNQCPKRRLHDTIKSLNKHHRKSLIRFRGDGTGEGVIWEIALSS